ncbi:MAG: aminopeptidase P family N-terminal domain-containing protein, partial [Chloroflexota bacterium]
MKGRLQRLRGEIADHGLDALLISQPENRRYLSGFTGSAGFLLVTESTAFLATDFRYTEQAQKQAPDFDVHRIEGEMQTWLPPLMSGVPGRKVGFEANGVTFHTYRQMAGAVGDKDLVPTEGLVENLRAVKDRGELDLILRAVEISDAAIE